MRLVVLEKKYECSGCTECCTVMSVRELRKPTFARCEHLGTDCNIYDQRPTRCRDWYCSYALGLLGEGENRRPDKSGLLFSTSRHCNALRLEIYECWPGAAVDLSRVENIVRKILDKIERTEKIAAVIFQPFGVRMGQEWEMDLQKYPEGAGVYFKWTVSQVMPNGWHQILGVREPSRAELQLLKTL